MKLLSATLLSVLHIFLTTANGEEPPLVRAVVRELAHDPSKSAPLEFRYVPGKEPPWWTVKLEIVEVLRGNPELKGQTMITATADSEPQGNGRFVTPRLNEGDVGIFAIKRLADGSWAQVYSPYEVEKGIWLPLVKRRHDAYEKVLSHLSGGEASQPSSDAKVEEETPKSMPTATPSQPAKPPAPKKITEAKPTPTKQSEEPASSSPWSIIIILILAAGAMLWLLLKPRF